MRRWVIMTAGLLIWAAHFLGLYLLSSAADVWSSADAPSARGGGWAFSFLCLALLAVIVTFLLRRPARDDPGRWERCVALAGALVAAVGIVWQTAPLGF
ncbi:hypothetical protein [Brevundimonas faecalis]|uniref:NO-binding membrane sensor protein with MHYT domain n=1 Tax=Brevundimonas faecalis TaxID=947378 RepID=A0ABV2R7Y7_9CAUL